MAHSLSGLAPAAASGGSNFLVPNATIIVELIAFLLIIAVLARYVIPPVNKALTARQEAIRTQFKDMEDAKAKAEASEKKYHDALSDAHHEANAIRAKAKDDGEKMIAEAREKAQAESARILATAQNQLAAERTHVVHALRSEVGGMATALAGRIVGESLDDEARRRRTVERFIEDLESSGSSDAAQSAPSGPSGSQG